MKTKKTIAAWLLALAALPAAGQTVYRCGNEYSQKPCTDARAVDVQDPRTAADARAASAQAERNAKLAGQMEKQRVAEERRVAGPSVVVTGEKPVAAKPEAAASQAKPGKKDKAKGKGHKTSGDFTATAAPKPGEGKAAKKKSG